jgi:putative SOS response-associated peptidase YedK
MSGCLRRRPLTFAEVLHHDRYQRALTAKVHDRMPVLLQPQDFDRWLTGTPGTELLKPAPDDYLQVWPVARRMNSSRAPGDDPALIERVAA